MPKFSDLNLSEWLDSKNISFYIFEKKLSSMELRVCIAEILIDLKIISEDEKKIVLDNSRPPQLKNISLSISHCPSMQGFAFVERPWSLGIDIEELERIKLKTVERISDKNELPQAPDPRFLWTAKEASFKSLYGPQQPQTLSQVKISSWQRVSSGLTTFEFKSNNINSLASPPGGIVFSYKHLIMGFSLIKA